MSASIPTSVARMPWIERRFIFDIPPGWMTNILVRLEGTTARLEKFVEGLTDEQLSTPKAGTWSIKDHIGHLSDLEPLHEGRIDDFIARKPLLRPADMNNLMTNHAGHNRKSIETLLKQFQELRSNFTRRLAALDIETMQFISMHPRLKQPMRPVDMAFFTAEHDDHHLATIKEIRKIMFSQPDN